MKYKLLLLSTLLNFLFSCTKDRDITIDSNNNSTDQNEDNTENEDLNNTSSLFIYWSFNSDIDSPDIGNGSFTYKGSDYDDTDGSTVNTVTGYTSGDALRLRNPSGDFIVSLPTTNYSEIIVKYAATRTSSGSKTQEIFYSVDGSNYIQDNLENTSLTISEGKESEDYETITLDFTQIESVNNNPYFKIKVVFDKDSSSSEDGNDRIDNITVKGIEQ